MTNSINRPMAVFAQQQSEDTIGRNDMAQITFCIQAPNSKWLTFNELGKLVGTASDASSAEKFILTDTLNGQNSIDGGNDLYSFFCVSSRAYLSSDETNLFSATAQDPPYNIQFDCGAQGNDPNIRQYLLYMIPGNHYWYFDENSYVTLNPVPTTDPDFPIPAFNICVCHDPA